MTAAVILTAIATAPPNGPGIFIGTPFAQDAGAWCQSVVPRQESFSPFVWVVNCSFSSKRESNPDPTADPVDFEWDSEEFKEVAAFDRDNKAILNSAGDYFPDPLTRDRSHKVATIAANMTGTAIFSTKGSLTFSNNELQERSDVFTWDGVTGPTFTPSS